MEGLKAYVKILHKKLAAIKKFEIKISYFVISFWQDNHDTRFIWRRMTDKNTFFPPNSHR